MNHSNWTITTPLDQARFVEVLAATKPPLMARMSSKTSGLRYSLSEGDSPGEKLVTLSGLPQSEGIQIEFSFEPASSGPLVVHMEPVTVHRGLAGTPDSAIALRAFRKRLMKQLHKSDSAASAVKG